MAHFFRPSMSFAALVFALWGCGSNQARNPDGSAASSASAVEKVAESGTSKASDLGCDEKAAGLGLTRIAGRDLGVFVDGKRTTLCEVLEQSGKPVAIFQFTGIFCLSCQEEAAYFEQALKKDPEAAKKIAHVIVVTDFPEDFPEKEFAGFTTKYAPSATRVHDDQIKLWKYFSKFPALPTRPTLFAMNQKMETAIINDEGADYKPMLGLALGLAP